jgi:trehalose 6-phosphate phosphatase
MQGASFVDTRLDSARAALNALVEAHPGTSIEDKGRTIAVHFRLAPQVESSLRESLIAITKPLGANYHIQEGNMVLEIKPRGFNKGTAIRKFMQEPPFSGRQPVFIGDDLTDQGGFQVVEEQGGISVAVGDRVRGQFRVDDPAAVRSWLRDVAALHDSHSE